MTRISAPELVSFDIFDTLVHRRLKAPVDLFEFVRVRMYETDHALFHDGHLANFAPKRIEAERLSRDRRQRDFGGEGEVTLDEIYREFGILTGCDGGLLKVLRETELDLERKVLVASPKGKALYDQHRAAGHRLALISDMYLPGDWLLDMLEGCGFEGARSLPIFVSGEVRLSKHTGTLFPHVQKHFGLANTGRWLHVGDNLTADIRNAAQHGLQTLHADWSQVDNRVVRAAPAHADHVIGSVLDFLQTPQSQQYIPSDPLEAIGYRIFGPMLFGFTCWLLARAAQEKYAKMLFIARDGWLPQQLFDGLKGRVGLGGIQSEYLYLSRRTAYQAGIREWDTDANWHFVAGQTKRSVSRCLQNVNVEAAAQQRQLAAFGLEDFDQPRDHQDHLRIKTLIDTLFAQSLSATAMRRAELASYYDQAVGAAGKVAIVDIGWHGNIQKALVHSASDPLLRDRVEGLYLGTLAGSSRLVENGHRLAGWMCNRGNPDHVQQLLFTGGVELLEFAMTADHGSAIDLRRNAAGQVEPVLEELGEAEAEYRAKAMRLQSGIRAFCADFDFLLDFLQPQTLASTAWITPFLRLVADPDPIELTELASVTHSDAPGATDIRLPLASRQPEIVRRTNDLRRHARERAFWKAAFDKLNA